MPANMICSDLSFAFYSTTASGDNIGSAGGSTATCGGGYTTDSFTEGGFAMRIVAWGFKVRFIGTELNKGGFITFHQMCPRNSMDTLNSTLIQSQFADWKQYPFCNRFEQFNRLYTELDDSLYMNMRADSDPANLWYYDDFSDQNQENVNYIGCYINGAAANVPFEVMVCGHYELIGPLNNLSGVASTTVNSAHLEKVTTKAALLRGVNNTTRDHSGDGGFMGKMSEAAKVVEALGTIF
jgi:hypothetical protein